MKNRQIMMLKVKMHILYIKYCQVFKISATFIAYNARHSAKNKSFNIIKLIIYQSFI